jgi:hypothetical protein
MTFFQNYRENFDNFTEERKMKRKEVKRKRGRRRENNGAVLNKNN